MRITAESSSAARWFPPSLTGLQVVAALTLSSALAACGGGGEAEAPGLFGPQGTPSTSASAMATPMASQTGSLLFASAAQYRQEALLSPAYTVLVDVDSAGGEAQAIADAMAAHVWERTNAAEWQAYFVASADRSTGVLVADLLTARGLPNVFLMLDAVSAETTTDVRDAR